MSRSRSRGKRFTSTQVLEALVRRARRIEGHSLAQDKQILADLGQGATPVEFVAAEQKAYLVRNFPPEEEVESTLARLRPVLLVDDIVTHNRVLRALGTVASGNERVTALLRGLKKDWARLRKSHPDGLGSFLQHMDADGTKSPVLSAGQLADART